MINPGNRAEVTAIGAFGRSGGGDGGGGNELKSQRVGYRQVLGYIVMSLKGTVTMLSSAITAGTNICREKKDQREAAHHLVGYNYMVL